MMFQICNDHGYIVEVYILDNDGVMRWHPLRNFGERQGDARAFKEYDCPNLEDWEIRSLIKNYKPEVKYQRLGPRKFKKT